ncbi:MAG: hypothetical protein Ct9H300mP6_09840 [Gammaproteobacteria bacterium]|nr:MAG: hypothetical protein Ct9H300mP6_09840 [Gammaproteobacteria bacterium]
MYLVRLTAVQEMSNARQTISAAKGNSEMLLPTKKLLKQSDFYPEQKGRIEVNLYDSARQDALERRKKL